MPIDSVDDLYGYDTDSGWSYGPDGWTDVGPGEGDSTYSPAYDDDSDDEDEEDNEEEEEDN